MWQSITVTLLPFPDSVMISKKHYINQSTSLTTTFLVVIHPSITAICMSHYSVRSDERRSTDGRKHVMCIVPRRKARKPSSIPTKSELGIDSSWHLVLQFSEYLIQCNSIHLDCTSFRQNWETKGTVPKIRGVSCYCYPTGAKCVRHGVGDSKVWFWV